MSSPLFKLLIHSWEHAQTIPESTARGSRSFRVNYLNIKRWERTTIKKPPTSSPEKGVKPPNHWRCSSSHCLGLVQQNSWLSLWIYTQYRACKDIHHRQEFAHHFPHNKCNFHTEGGRSLDKPYLSRGGRINFERKKKDEIWSSV